MWVWVPKVLLVGVDSRAHIRPIDDFIGVCSEDLEGHDITYRFTETNEVSREFITVGQESWFGCIEQFVACSIVHLLIKLELEEVGDINSLTS